MVTTSIQIRFNDMDLAGHAHNGVYLTWFELGRMAFFRTFIEREHDWKKQGMILARNEVDHRAPVHLNDQAEVDCWCDRIGNTSFDLRYRITVLKDGQRQLRTEGRSVMVCFDYTTNSPIPVPAAWRTALARMMDTDKKTART
ncbi:MAG TPA: thioesterase family protein [Flavobacteriales bacterium]|nr:thioesterase family protein [Flavobacteriales bacterium]